MKASVTYAAGGYVFTASGVLETMVCGDCGILFALPEEMLDWARKTPSLTWYCPNGHSRHFPGKTLEQKLREAKEALAREKASHDQTQASLTAQRGAATRARNERDRIKKRVTHGVCPCCNRTFKQLAAHMRNKHPEFAETVSE